MRSVPYGQTVWRIERNSLRSHVSFSPIFTALHGVYGKNWALVQRGVVAEVSLSKKAVVVYSVVFY